MTHEPDARLESAGRSRRTFMRNAAAIGGAIALGGFAPGVAGAQDGAGRRFTVRIENVSEEGTLMPSSGGEQAVPLSPGVYAVYAGENPIFTVGESDRGAGLEAIAEDGNPSALSASLTTGEGVRASGVFSEIEDDDDGDDADDADDDDGTDDNDDDGPDDADDDGIDDGDDDTDDNDDNDDADDGDDSEDDADGDDDDDDANDDDDDETGPIGPGQHYEFAFDAEPGERLTFATMFVPSNDLFYAPVEAGIELYQNDGPIGGDVTDQVELWDAGTEENEEPGVGTNQVQRQSGPDTGPDEGGSVRSIEAVDDGFTYPAVADVIRVTVTPRTTNGEMDDDDDDNNDDNGDSDDSNGDDDNDNGGDDNDDDDGDD